MEDHKPLSVYGKTFFIVLKLLSLLTLLKIKDEAAIEADKPNTPGIGKTRRISQDSINSMNLKKRIVLNSSQRRKENEPHWRKYNFRPSTTIKKCKDEKLCDRGWVQVISH